MAVAKATPKKLIAILIALAAIVAAGIFVYFGFIAKKNKPPVTLTQSSDHPDETDPKKSGYVWSGGPDDPKKIVIPSIGVDNYIQNVGLDKNNQIVSPGNIYIAGWYTKSARPGRKGLSIMDGHLNGYQHDGIFVNLNKLKSGEEFSVEMGDGRKFRYKVINNNTVDENKATGYLFSQNPKVIKQLNLITCGGDYNRNTRYYSKRVIVEAEQI